LEPLWLGQADVLVAVLQLADALPCAAIELFDVPDTSFFERQVTPLEEENK
jgi:hypothetical protein